MRTGLRAQGTAEDEGVAGGPWPVVGNDKGKKRDSTQGSGETGEG